MKVTLQIWREFDTEDRQFPIAIEVEDFYKGRGSVDDPDEVYLAEFGADEWGNQWELTNEEYERACDLYFEERSTERAEYEMSRAEATREKE